MAAIKVIGVPTSTCTQRVLVVLIEKGAEYVIQPLDMMNGAHKKPEHLAIQPFGQIPVIVDGTFTLFESRGIVRYLADKYEGQGPSLYGKTLHEKALVEQWLAVEIAITAAVVQLVLGPKFRGIPTDEAIVYSSLEKLEKVLDVYEAHLAKSKFLAGDFLSIADLVQLPFLFLLVEVAKRGEVVTSRKHVHKWYETISSLPSWKKVLSLYAWVLLT
ncbi:hypothetical protein O6H91_02G046600 [Diphasiastrum complanatum]|uniref:Uncharacterized protein n=2 Tax=Diphasiastrum complanatum TaxID=34168 RepID=A0ACC2EDV5_DIPCM|nr:hypothetical protein O6H91_02G028600 [Diphasiastrum complanatum]KAJ7565074.1 hypothetical protein O6H91_02G046600 [Diphasiastrum complanatum]